MAPNSYTYIRMKAEYMCQQPMLRKLKNHAQFFQNEQKFENFQNFLRNGSDTGIAINL